jgi:hypothetical protein
MKRLFFGLIATVIFSFAGNAQQFKKSRSQDRTFMYLNVIALLESKTEFQASKSKEEFVTIYTKGVNDANYVKIMTPYLYSVYQMHASRYTQDNAYDKADLNLLYDTHNKVAEYAKTNSNFNSLIQSKIRFNWGNLFRKVVDAIIDSFEEVKEP